MSFDLVYNAKTRIGAESLLYYNLEAGVKVGSIVKTATGYSKNQESSCAETLALPTSGFVAAIVRVSNKGAMTVGSGTFPAHSPVGAAIEYGGSPSLDIDDFDLTAAEVGDQIDIVVLPGSATDVLLCYEQGFSAEVGDAQRAIPRKLNAADHYVRQRPENRISLTDLMVNNWYGLKRISGVPVTLICRIYPDGGGAASEIIYFTNVRVFVPPINSPGEGNDSIEISAEGSFNDLAIFAAQPES